MQREKGTQTEEETPTEEDGLLEQEGQEVWEKEDSAISE